MCGEGCVWRCTFFQIRNLHVEFFLAMFEMGRRYKYGEDGAELSLEKAVDHYKKGIKLGDPSGMNDLGCRYATS